jgi:hypothetical protein
MRDLDRRRLDYIGSRVGRPDREGNQSSQEPVGEREEHESSLHPA